MAKGRIRARCNVCEKELDAAHAFRVAQVDGLFCSECYLRHGRNGAAKGDDAVLRVMQPLGMRRPERIAPRERPDAAPLAPAEPAAGTNTPSTPEAPPSLPLQSGDGLAPTPPDDSPDPAPAALPRRAPAPLAQRLAGEENDRWDGAAPPAPASRAEGQAAPAAGVPADAGTGSAADGAQQFSSSASVAGRLLAELEQQQAAFLSYAAEPRE
ncbi:MAG: hypothetical protein NVSMB65_16430 [Chloroflexota bacterium]